MKKTTTKKKTIKRKPKTVAENHAEYQKQLEKKRIRDAEKLVKYAEDQKRMEIEYCNQYQEKLKQYREELIVKASSYERDLKDLLDEFGVSYEYQKILMIRPDKGFIVDFYLTDYKAILELDGLSHDPYKDGARDLLIWNTSQIPVVRFQCSYVKSLEKYRLVGLINKTISWYKTAYSLKKELLSNSIEEYFMDKQYYSVEGIHPTINLGYVKTASGLRNLKLMVSDAPSTTNREKYNLY